MNETLSTQDSVPIAYAGELQFRRYSDTSTQGVQLVFGVADREHLESFIGKEGKRYQAVLVELSDIDEPVPQKMQATGVAA